LYIYSDLLPAFPSLRKQLNDERAAIAKLCISGEKRKRFWNTRDSLKVAWLVWKSVLFVSSFASLLFLIFWERRKGDNFSALRIKMRNDKPSAAGHALPRPSAKLQFQFARGNERIRQGSCINVIHTERISSVFTAA